MKQLLLYSSCNQTTQKKNPTKKEEVKSTKK